MRGEEREKKKDRRGEGGKGKEGSNKEREYFQRFVIKKKIIDKIHRLRTKGRR